MKEALDLNQNLHLTQRLSPRQVQFVRLLEMTSPEFEEEVRRQLDDNPALETDDDHYESADGAEASDAGTTEPESGADEYDPNDDPIERYQGGGDKSEYSWQLADDGADLNTYLLSQLREMDLAAPIDKIAKYIVGNLDANGYLTRTLAAMANDIAIDGGGEVTMDQMQQAFAVVRALDPAGVGAIDLRDCVLLQLRRVKPSSLPLKIAIEIVADYFDLLSKKHYDRLQSLLGLQDDAELRKAIDIIRSLNPKPGSVVSGGALQQRMAQLTPDVGVDVADGRVSVWIASSVPHLQIERSFDMDSVSKPRNKNEREAQAFIKLKRDDAEAFISAIRQRNSTLLSVTEAIARRQIDFFKTGDKAVIRPMILRDIAQDTGLDMSMVSRATAGKYVATDMGIFPLKMFFNEASADKPDTSAHQLLHMLKQVIDAEDPNHPLSDREIQLAMEEKGVKMARRTVTKYREKLGLPVGRLRKKL